MEKMLQETLKIPAQPIATHGKRPRPELQGLTGVYRYVPLTDITTEELAELVELLVMGLAVGTKMVPPPLLDITYQTLSDEAKRHIQVKEKSNLIVPR